MCGIAGWLCADAATPPAPLLDKMFGQLSHRGPNGSGMHVDAGVALIHRRLAIIDLAGGRQPLANEDSQVIVVFNGEIYNSPDLRTQLIARGHVFKTHSDTEVLVHLYEEHGPQMLEQLRGMFAFAIWDARQRRLFLARDRFGIKPLYYSHIGGQFLFASELKAILATGLVPRDLSAVAVRQFVTYGMTIDPTCIFAHIRKLPPGHALLLSPGEPEPRPNAYWQLTPRLIEVGDQRDHRELAERVERKIEEAVRLHLLADVPIGAFLSGGLDSTLVTALASTQVDGPLHTFSMGFEGHDASELPAARLVATQFGCRHTEQVVSMDASAMLDRLAFYFDEPFGDSSAVPTWCVSKLASDHVRVVLSGDGGDEAFGGYARYRVDLREAALRERLPPALRRQLGKLAAYAPRRARSALINLSRDAASAYARTLSICRSPVRERLLGLTARDFADADLPAITAYDRARRSGFDPLTCMQLADVAVMLPADYLTKVDRASMACGLEVRPPLLDHELMELGLALPVDCKVARGQTKRLIRQIVARRVSPELATRRKQGFELPIRRWLAGPLSTRLSDAIHAPGSSLDGIFDRRYLQHCLVEHTRGEVDHSALMWNMVTFAAWADVYARERFAEDQAHMAAAVIGAAV